MGTSSKILIKYAKNKIYRYTWNNGGMWFVGKRLLAWIKDIILSYDQAEYAEFLDHLAKYKDPIDTVVYRGEGGACHNKETSSPNKAIQALDAFIPFNAYYNGIGETCLGGEFCYEVDFYKETLKISFDEKVKTVPFIAIVCQDADDLIKECERGLLLTRKEEKTKLNSVAFIIISLIMLLLYYYY